MKRKSNVLTYWCILLYFIVLMTERIMSLVLSFKEKGFQVFDSLFSIYAYGMVIISLIAFLILLFTMNIPFLAALVTNNEETLERVSAKKYSILIGVILVSGMIHTEHTITWLQFVAYGFLIIGMIIANIDNLKYKKSDATQWISLIYLIAYSMAIPVVYESHMTNALAFHIVEAAASLILIGLFTFMTYKVFAGKAGNLLYVEPLHIAMFLNIAVIWMRWSEEINYFLMIAMGTAIVLWLVGKYKK